MGCGSGTQGIELWGISGSWGFEGFEVGSGLVGRASALT